NLNLGRVADKQAMGSLSLRASLGLFLVAISAAEWINSEITRTIDAKEHVVRIKTEYVLNGGKGEYLVAYPAEFADRIAYIAAEAGKGKDIPISQKEIKDGLVFFSTDLGTSKLLTVSAVIVNPFEMLPAEITQQEPQFVVYEDTELVPSPYPTETQTTKLKLPSKNTLSVQPEEDKRSGATLTFGPHDNTAALAAGAFGSLRAHFMNNFPAAVAHDVFREIEVSHWGNVAVEELYEVRHAGARLKGGFSRIDFMQKRLRESPAFTALTARIPAEARGIYYRDQIGNVSSSDIRPAAVAGQIELEIRPRFPLFGGWKTEWYQGWNLPSEAGLTRSEGGRYTLTADFGIPFKDVWVEDHQVKVILPEGATDIEVRVPFEVEEGRSSRATYLDTPLMGGRPIVTLRKLNVVREHNRPFTVSYTFRPHYMLH
ncbi:unnamed protein product, partial [Heterosigma akashiwo]